VRTRRRAEGAAVAYAEEGATIGGVLEIRLTPEAAARLLRSMLGPGPVLPQLQAMYGPDTLPALAEAHTPRHTFRPAQTPYLTFGPG
jgi:hypothetical protein